MNEIPIQANATPIQIVVDQPKASTTLKLWHFILIGIVVFYCVKWFRNINQKWARYKRDVRCRGRSNRVLVIVYSFRDATKAAGTIMALLRAASCPSLVSFAIYQEFDGMGDADVHSACASMCTDDEEREYVDHLRILSRDDATATSRGPLHGIREAFRQARKGEKFCCVVPVGTRAIDCWDEVWLKEYEHAVETLPWTSSSVVLTCEPEDMRTPNRPKARHVREDHIGAVAQNMLRNLTETTQEAIVAKPRETYPVMGGMNGLFPEVSTRIFPQSNDEAVQSIVCGSCIMTTSKTMKMAMRFGSMSCPPYALNFLMSALLYTHSKAVFVAAKPVFLRSEKPHDMRPAQWNSRDLHAHMNKYYSEYCDFAGVDLKHSVVLGRGILGVLMELESSDILSKFGTRREFERAKSQFSS